MYIVYRKYFNKVEERMTLETPYMIGTREEVLKELDIKEFNYMKDYSLRDFNSIVHTTTNVVVCKA